MPAKGSNRLRQAQQRRSKAGGGPRSPASASGGGDDDDDALVLTGSCTLVIALIIVGIGAGLAILFFNIHQPGCMDGLNLFGFGTTATTIEEKATSTTRRQLRQKRNLMTINEQEQKSTEGVVLIP